MWVRFCSVFGIMFSAGTAHAGAVVKFEFDPPSSGYLGDACFQPNTDVTVDVFLYQDAGGSDQRLRMVELDFRLTSPELAISFPTTHDRATVETSDDVHFWRFDSLAGCFSAPSFCGFNHHFDFDMGAGPVDTRERVVSATFFGQAVDPTAQILLPGGANPSPVTVGRFRMRTPNTFGTYTLNVVNAADVDANRRARIDFGFDPHTTWRAGTASPNNLWGGAQQIEVRDFCHGDPSCFGIVSAVPRATPVGVTTVPTNGTLWRSQRNVIRIACAGTFPSVPRPDQIEIVQLLPGGAFGPNVAANGFTFTLENGPNGTNSVLRIADDTTSDFQHRTWFAVRTTGGWPGVAPFELQWPVVVGDADGNRFTTSADVGLINAGVAGPQSDQSRVDINGDRFKTPTDVSIANASIGPPPPKPTGH